jgi:hypothetical protein
MAASPAACGTAMLVPEANVYAVPFSSLQRSGGINTRRACLTILPSSTRPFECETPQVDLSKCSCNHAARKLVYAYSHLHSRKLHRCQRLQEHTSCLAGDGCHDCYRHRHTHSAAVVTHQLISFTWRKQVDAVAVVGPAVWYLFVLRISTTRRCTLHAADIREPCIANNSMRCRTGHCTNAVTLQAVRPLLCCLRPALTDAEVTAHLVARSLALTVRAPGTLAGATVHASTPLLPAA